MNIRSLTYTKVNESHKAHLQEDLRTDPSIQDDRVLK